MQSMNGLFGLPTTIGSIVGFAYLSGAERAPEPALDPDQYCVL
jgi:hypothetical protein